MRHLADFSEVQLPKKWIFFFLLFFEFLMAACLRMRVIANGFVCFDFLFFCGSLMYQRAQHAAGVCAIAHSGHWAQTKNLI